MVTGTRLGHFVAVDLCGRSGGQPADLRICDGRVLPNKGVVRLQLEERQPQGGLHRTGRQRVPDLVPALERLSIPRQRQKKAGQCSPSFLRAKLSRVPGRGNGEN